MTEEQLLALVYTAALFGLRKMPGKKPELWRMHHEIYCALGYPPDPMTAPWVKR